MLSNFKKKFFQSKRRKRFIVNHIASLSMMRREKIYRKCGLDIGKNTVIWDGAFFDDVNDIKIGDRCFVNRQCTFASGMRLEDDVVIGRQMLALSSNHEIGGRTHRAGKTVKSPILVKRGSWIGARVTILAGVTIGEGCVIAAGSVVTKDCEPNGVYAGVPAKRIKDLPSEIKETE
jgi:maltose O-acetyltransferase